MTMQYIIDAILISAAIVVLLPIAAFCVETLAALLPGGKGNQNENLPSPCGRGAGGEGNRESVDIIRVFKRFSPHPNPLPKGEGTDFHSPRTAILIPAHDEQAVIHRTLKTVASMLSPADRLLVVADNCTDQTADLARRAGAEVIERNDPVRRGKGFALQAGLRRLAADPPDVVVMIDADTIPEPAAIGIMSRRARQTGRPVQARNLTDLRRANGPIEAVSIFANRIINLVRPTGLARLGAPCRMTGTGMAIPWEILEQVGTGGGNLVEDMQMGIDLALGGHPPLFCPEAGVSSAMPDSTSAFASQRTRWEHGHLHTAVGQAPRLLRAAVRRRSWPLLAMGVDLCIPPLTLLIAAWFVLILICSSAWLLGASWLPAVMLSVGGCLFGLSLIASWAKYCRRQVPLNALIAAPLYMLRKMPIYARFLFNRQTAWVRTERDSAS